ncbi:complement C3-like isoform X2 [Anguilla rostrata]|uniref:complement C3-like isoform X2 n=1 Tax=Anguilla rostrata TaxID=7938 RepID=UPI0030D1D384
MDRTYKMHLGVLWLAVLALSLPALSQCEPLFVLTAPNLLRVGCEEKVFVEAQEYTGGSLSVIIRVMDFPGKYRNLFSKTVTLSEENSFQALQEILISDVFEEETLRKQYVYLQAIFPQKKLEKPIQVSFQSGYIFAQTDKTIYSPLDRVNYRVFALDAALKPTRNLVSVDIMSPDGNIVRREIIFPNNGISSQQYRLPETSSVGTWKMVSRFKNNLQNFTYEFEVKEYVKPNIEVTLTPEKKFFYIDETELSVEVAARYLYGEDVSGKAFVVFGVLTEDGEKKSIPASLQRVNIDSGKGKAKLTREQILTTFPDIRQLVKLSLYVSVSVLTDSGSEMVEGERRGIQIVTSPYTIHFKKTPSYFKQGMPFDVRVYVTNVDNTPVKFIELEVTPGPIFGRTQANGEARFLINTQQGASPLPITVKTKAPALTNERQAVAHMTALPYRTQGGSKNDLYISIKNSDLHIGGSLSVYLTLVNSPSVQAQIKHITYLVMSKGQLIRAGRYKALHGQSLIALHERVTKDMVPSFRIVAYYHVGTEVVSDSIWVDVKDICMGTLEVTSTKPKDVYEPRKLFSLTITGDPGAKVGLVAVDKGVYVLNNKNRLTQAKIWDIVEKHDTGCTPGSGADSMGVLYDAGLAFESSAGGTRSRSDPNCPIHPKSRRRRSLGEEDDEYVSNSDIISRVLFAESWLWEVIHLPECPLENRECKSTSATKSSFLKDSITTWEITAISLSETHGICVADPFEIKVRKNFFIDLKLPYAAVRNEQLEIKAVLYNYREDKIKVRVELMETEQVCSAASKKRKYRLPDVDMDPMSSRAVSFVIIPMALGLHSIEVKAAVHDSIQTDGVKKDLHVVAEGLQTRRVVTVPLNPSNYGGVQIQNISVVQPISQVPGSPGYTYISVKGELPRLANQKAISGSPMGHLIAQPNGNAETIMIGITGPVIATHYLDKTNQWEKVGLERRAEAINFIEMGYTKLLVYRNNEGAFSIWKDRNPSSWLVAYILKVFRLTHNLIKIDEDVLCRAFKWLALKTQQPDGIFKEVGRVYYEYMVGGIQGKDSDVSLTAFILVAMQEARHICVEEVNSLQVSMKKASEFLSGRIHSLTNPYAVALTAYALANEGNHQLDILNRFSSGQTHWPVSDSHMFTLEATGYALMVLVQAKEFDQAGRVVEWLTEQKFYGGGPGSTQATIIVFQAVAMYITEISDTKDTELQVRLTTRNWRKPIVWMFAGNAAHITRTHKVQPDVNVTVTATGTGEGTLSVMTIYNSLPEEKEPECRNFELEVKLKKEPHATDENVLETYKLTIDMTYLSDRDATMSILDITLLTGFIADKKDLEMLTAGKDQYVKKIEMNTQLSEKGSLTLYVDKVSHQLPDRVAFRIHKIYNVGLLQPAAVTLYEYYSMESRCMKFYHPEKKNGTLNRICHEDVCRCAEENCSFQRKENKKLDRVSTACSTSINYVYKVRVLSTDLTYTIDRFTVLVEDVIKEGADPVVRGKNLTFAAHPQCRQAIGLKEGKTYLIMGKPDNLSKIGERMMYMLGEGTWIEYWPTEPECQQPAFRETCLGIVGDTADLLMFGCPI